MLLYHRYNFITKINNFNFVLYLTPPKSVGLDPSKSAGLNLQATGLLDWVAT